MVPRGDGVHHAVAQVVLQYHLSRVSQGRAHGGQLDQHVRAVLPVGHHPPHLFQMPDGPGQTVQHRFLVLMDMAVAVGDAVGVAIGVVVFVWHGCSLVFPRIVSPHPACGRRRGLIKYIIVAFIPKGKDKNAKMHKKLTALALAAALTLGMGLPALAAPEETTLVYASGDYTRIDPAMDEHGEINILLFNGLTAHDGDNNVVPGLAKSWEFDEETCSYTFHMAENARWHDGQPVTAGDVKFTIEAIMDPANLSENAPNFEDVTAIDVLDEHTVRFTLAAPNAAFLDYMTMAVLPEHLLAGEDFQTSDFFRAPVGTGPYKLESWDPGQAITLVKNEDYFKTPAKIDRIIFKIVPDDAARTLQMRSGELDLALLPPRDAESFAGQSDYAVYNMKTADYRGILFNFWNEYWTENRDIIPAVCCALDRQAILDSVLLGHGDVAYGPLQRNVYDCPDVERYDYDPDRARSILEAAGATPDEEGFYCRDGARLGFTIDVAAGDQVRLDMARAAAQQLRQVGLDVTVEIPAVVDWGGQMAYLIGWGSPFDADDHTYKVFGTDKGANYSGYSNADVDKYLTLARQSDDPVVRAEAYASFQKALADDPAYAFLCYVDADYVAKDTLRGIDPHTVMGHHGVGIFWNVTQWEMDP